MQEQFCPLEIEIIERDQEEAIKSFRKGRRMEGIDLEEVRRLASRRKRELLIASGQMGQIGQEAEDEFRRIIRSDPEAYGLYMAMKAGRNVATQEFRVGGRSEAEIKGEYIAQRISLNEKDTELVDETVRGIAKRNSLREIRRLRSLFAGQGENRRGYDKFLGIVGAIGRESVEVYNTRELHSFLVRGITSDVTPSFVYYLCLRWNNRDGEIDIEPSLKPFEFVGKSGEIERRSGESKIFQLNKAREVRRLLGEFGVIDHRIVVADFDLWRHSPELAERLREKVEGYICECQKFVGDELKVSTQTAFFKEAGLDDREYAEIEGSVLNGSGRFINKRFVEDQIKRNRVKKGEFLSDWGDEANRVYTVRGIARNIAEGVVMARRLYVPGAFSKNAAMGYEFSAGVSGRLPFVCWPIHKDGVGNVSYA